MKKSVLIILMSMTPLCSYGATPAGELTLKCEMPRSSRSPIVLKGFRADRAHEPAYPHEVENLVLSNASPGQTKRVEATFQDELITLKARGDSYSLLQIAMSWRDLDPTQSGDMLDESGKLVRPALVRFLFEDSPSHMGETGVAICTFE